MAKTTRGWKKKVESIRLLDLPCIEKQILLAECKAEMGASDDEFDRAFTDVLMDYRTCEECDELFPDTSDYFSSATRKRGENICRKCMGESSRLWKDEFEREAYHEENRRRYREEGHVNDPESILTNDEVDFLLHHNIPMSEVFDATGLGPKQYGALMSRMGYFVACGVTECKKNYHGLRNKRGTCIQCNPAVIAHERRYKQEQFVYLAYSKNSGLAKVGVAADVTKRAGLLSECCYGGATDWAMVTVQRCRDSARVEYSIHKRLVEYSNPVAYWQGADKHISRETFSCGLKVAKEAFEWATGTTGSWVTRILMEVYSWPQHALPQGRDSMEDMKSKIRLALSKLGDADAEMIRLYYGVSGKESLGLEGLAQYLGTTTNRVRKSVLSAQRKMRHPSISIGLDGHVAQYHVSIQPCLQ